MANFYIPAIIRCSAGFMWASRPAGCEPEVMDGEETRC
jgi:hypothetical protein